jgi:hypothetical protein
MKLMRSLLLLVCLAAPAFAQDGPAIAIHAREGLTNLQRHVQEAAKTNSRPDFSKPPASAEMRRLFDVQALNALPPNTAADISWLNEWLNTSVQGFQLLIFAGTKAGPEMNAQMVERNLVDYQREIAMATEFMLRLQARVSKAALLFFDKLTPAQRADPVRQGGLKKLQAGFIQSVGGAIQMLAGGFQPGHARRISSGLRDTVAVWSAFASPDQRTNLLKGLAAGRAASKDATVEADLLAVSTALADVK